jgi:aerotaxis receptor
MRVNQPVSQTEFAFPAGETLVSTTDLKGRILYGNPTFFAVSGYSKDELLGQPHNMIRHPDMPEEAFRDMWHTIASGLPWSAPVKNRRKDGSFYWVMANVTPLMEGDAPVGYMSVRTEVTRQQIQAATALYATMRAEKAQGRLVHTLRNATLHKNTLAGRLGRALHLGLAARLGVLTGLLASATAVATAAATGASLGAATWGAAAAAGTVAGLLGAWWMAGMAIRPVQALLGIANRMAAGDLTQNIEAGGDDAAGLLRRAMSQLNVNLRSIVRDARTEVGHMHDATREIASGNQDLSARTESQAASLEQTASSMEEITSTVRNAATAAGEAARLAARASAVTQEGSEAMNAVTQTMHVITDSSKRIGEIIGVIDGIAFQTNILALNAAVEAARAGEQGRGFAVVASEVRALAGRTTQAAREIKQLISESTDKVEAGNRLTEGAQKTMDGALLTVREVTTVIEGISHGATEQLTGISQVNEAVAQIDGITQQNAALVEEIAAAATQLQTQAANVAEAVQIFRLDSGRSAQPDAVALRRSARQAQPA